MLGTERDAVASLGEFGGERGEESGEFGLLRVRVRDGDERPDVRRERVHALDDDLFGDGLRLVVRGCGGGGGGLLYGL